MNILGHQIELLLFLQIVLTAVVIIVYFFTNSLKETPVENLATHQMVPLISFLFKHRPDIPDFPTLTELRPTAGFLGSYASLLLKRLQQYFDGKSPYEVSLERADPSQSSTLTIFCIAVVAVLLAPVVVPVIFLAEVYPGKPFRRERIETTEVRQQNFSITVILAVPNLLLVALGIALAGDHFWWALAALAVGGLNMLLLIITAAQLIVEQQRWKRFWQESFLAIMAAAERTDDHELFNRALLLHNYIDGQPDTPVPGNLGLYAVVYSAVQALLYGGFSLVGRT
jgi:hypothetical protein